MRRIVQAFFVILLLSTGFALAGCGAPPPEPDKPLKVGVMIDSGSENDRSFNEYTLAGVREAAKAEGLDYFFMAPQSTDDYERTLEIVVAEAPDLVFTVGFRMGDATAKLARKYPERHFVIVDHAYEPGFGCPETVSNCYTPAGELDNVTSLMFAEDEVGYLAGVLAACMSESGTIASVAGMEIPPVVRFVTGFQNGAQATRPGVTALNQYIPDFNDPATGKVIAQGFINDGADVIFGVGGNTGNGGLLAAHEAGLMAIGVDIDQYYTYPEVQSTLLSSASKNVDVAAAAAVHDFVSGNLQPGVRLFTLANAGVGLAPFHDWETKIPAACKTQLDAARNAIIADPAVTGAK